MGEELFWMVGWASGAWLILWLNIRQRNRAEKELYRRASKTGPTQDELARKWGKSRGGLL